jgi:hypothetical protein
MSERDVNLGIVHNILNLKFVRLFLKWSFLLRIINCETKRKEQEEDQPDSNVAK